MPDLVSEGVDKMIKGKINAVFMILITICIFSLASSKNVLAQEEEKVAIGVHIDTVDIGGMTASEAEAAVDQYIEELKSNTITVQVEEDSESVTLEELGFHSKDHDYIEDALQFGKSGNIIKRYKELKDIENEKLVYSLEFTFDNDKLKEFVETKLSAYDMPAKNASVKREGGAMVYTDHVVGRLIDVQDTIQAIEVSISEGWDKEDIQLNAVVTSEEPKYTRDMVEKVKDKLGSFTTNYSSSTQDRAANLANGAKLINNTVIYPGEEFNAYDKLTPFTTKNGYSVGGAYANGKLVDSIGGGACQVTTTLYNAALYAELDITERAEHSMTISYTDLSRDAAIAGTWKNLRFANDTEYPILIQAQTKNRNITFTIWGYDDRPDNRTIEYKTVVKSETKPPKDVVTEDPTKPVTYEKVTQAAHKGYVAELYKIVYENGKEVSRTQINRSVYQATPRYITRGTMPEPTPTPSPTPAPTTPEPTPPETTPPETESNSEKPVSGGEPTPTKEAPKPEEADPPADPKEE